MMATASRMDSQRLDRVPSCMPRRFPARLRSWQGEPPLMMSTGGTLAQSTVVTSPRFGMPGQWWAMIFEGAASNSAYQATFAPKTCSTARPRPP
jgi:hypothetical protein